VQRQIAEDQVEAALGEGQGFLVGGKARAAGPPRHRFRKIALHEIIDLAGVAKCRLQVSGMAAKVERARKTPGDVKQPVGQASGDLLE